LRNTASPDRAGFFLPATARSVGLRSRSTRPPPWTRSPCFVCAGERCA